MKTKNITPQVEPEDNEEQEESGAEVASGGPAIAPAKKGKITIIAASVVLITVVMYFMFFKSEDKVENLQVVETPEVAVVAPSPEGKSFFELDDINKSKDDLELLQKPAAPEVPTLPALPEGAMQSQDPLAPAPPILADILPGQKQQLTNQVPANAQKTTPVESNSNPTKDEPIKKELDPRYSPIIVVSNPANSSGPALGVGYGNNIVNLKMNPIDKLDKSTVTVKTTYIEDMSHTIAQGKLLNAILETAINTELPGFVRAIVSRDVYGESGKDVLIPRGSRLFGAYSSQIQRGQGRVEIGWTRLIRPDGVDLAITFNASDQFGRSGVQGETDNKYGSVVANSMLTSILAVGGVAAAQKLIGGNQQTVTTSNPQQGTTTTAGSASNQAIYDVSKAVVDTVGRIINNTIDLNPVVRIPQGTRITVIVNSDIKIPSMEKN
jgi:type IV secretion system protein VirB10